MYRIQPVNESLGIAFECALSHRFGLTIPYPTHRIYEPYYNYLKGRTQSISSVFTLTEAVGPRRHPFDFTCQNHGPIQVKTNIKSTWVCPPRIGQLQMPINKYDWIQLITKELSLSSQILFHYSILYYRWQDDRLIWIPSIRTPMDWKTDQIDYSYPKGDSMTVYYQNKPVVYLSYGSKRQVWTMRFHLYHLLELFPIRHTDY